MNNGIECPTFYFTSEGKQNLGHTVNLVYKRLSELNIKKVLVFTSNGEGAFLIKEKLGKKRTKVIAVTFPYKKPFYIDGPDGSKKQVFANTSNKEFCEGFKKKGIHLVQGVMALQDIFVPGSGVYESKIQTINLTLSLISGGLKLCVEAILMATDAGLIEQGEEVIAFSADTAIVGTGCRKEWLFHTEHGLEVREIICKPRKLSPYTHKKSEKSSAKK